MSTRRAWLILLLAWLPIAIGFPIAIMVQGGPDTLGHAFFGMGSMAAAGILGLGVWWLSGRIRWPDRPGASFYVLHLAIGLLYSSVWWLATVMQRALFGNASLEQVLRNITSNQWLGWDLLFGLVMYGLLVGISYTIRSRDAIREQRLSSARAEADLARARLTALQAQLNPHFLFNTLHSLSVLVRTDPVTAEEALDQLGDLLRYALDQAERDTVLLREEWAFVQDYLAIEKLRLGARLTVRESVATVALSRRVPPFCLQPLVENAIQHGIGPCPRGGVLDITIRMDGQRLVLEVADDGVGADVSRVSDRRGLGLRGVRERLNAKHEFTGELEIETRIGDGFTARVVVEYQTAPSELPPVETVA
jgi:sensor histidine kinase YesM